MPLTLASTDLPETLDAIKMIEVVERNLDSVGFGNQGRALRSGRRQGLPFPQATDGEGRRRWKARVAEPKPANGYLRWHGDEAA